MQQALWEGQSLPASHADLGGASPPLGSDLRSNSVNDHTHPPGMCSPLKNYLSAIATIFPSSGHKLTWGRYSGAIFTLLHSSSGIPEERKLVINTDAFHPLAVHNCSWIRDNMKAQHPSPQRHNVRFRGTACFIAELQGKIPLSLTRLHQTYSEKPKSKGICVLGGLPREALLRKRDG